jgi:hypothetical protein
METVLGNFGSIKYCATNTRVEETKLHEKVQSTSANEDSVLTAYDMPLCVPQMHLDGVEKR